MSYRPQEQSVFDSPTNQQWRRGHEIDYQENIRANQIASEHIITDLRELSIGNSISVDQLPHQRPSGHQTSADQGPRDHHASVDQGARGRQSSSPRNQRAAEPSMHYIRDPRDPSPVSFPILNYDPTTPQQSISQLLAYTRHIEEAASDPMQNEQPDLQQALQESLDSSVVERQITTSVREPQSRPLVAIELEINDAGGKGDCVICMAELKIGEGLKKWPKCNHYFHDYCIDTWLQTRDTCPLCRAKA